MLLVVLGELRDFHEEAKQGREIPRCARNDGIKKG
jgi:hypothetical protein